MDILILGGTLFLGRHLVEAALARGHRVTLFNRGSTGPTLFPEVEHLIGDRDGGLDALAGRRFDAVIDTCGYVPRVVRESAALLADAARYYVFISSGSVYEDSDRASIGENAPICTINDEANENVYGNYGPLKALCERAVESAFAGRALHVRAGLIVGPYDVTGRLEYWVRRIAEGGEVLAPGRPDRQIQLIHARDLADWIFAMTEASRPGLFNAAGPAHRLTMRDLLDTCNALADDPAALTWVDESFLLLNYVAPFADLPLWLPASQNGLLSMDIGKALASGLRFRPLADTLADTTRWLDEERAAGKKRPARLASGVATRDALDRQRERALLDAWKRSSTKVTA